METITVKAELELLDDVLAFIETAAVDMPPKMQNQLAIAVEEIFVNIANYSYEAKNGDAVITAANDGEKLTITFEDMGIPYNPLAKNDPDITASADDRKIGGLGIFMAKKLTDGMEYSFKDGKNILTIHKNISDKA
jgi:anti-sigma regulatory factor (Ser/Thr protein kinase)